MEESKKIEDIRVRYLCNKNNAKYYGKALVICKQHWGTELKQEDKNYLQKDIEGKFFESVMYNCVEEKYQIFQN